MKINMDEFKPLIEEILVIIKRLLGEEKLNRSQLKEKIYSDFKFKDGDVENKYQKGTKKVAGVYLIYKDNNIIYIGETDNLVRRLVGDIGRYKTKEGKIELFHSLNRHVRDKNLLLTAEEIMKKIEEDYLFSYVETSKDMAIAIEGILIQHFRKTGFLINKKEEKLKL